MFLPCCDLLRLRLPLALPPSLSSLSSFPAPFTSPSGGMEMSQTSPSSAPSARRAFGVAHCSGNSSVPPFMSTSSAEPVRACIVFRLGNHVLHFEYNGIRVSFFQASKTAVNAFDTVVRVVIPHPRILLTGVIPQRMIGNDGMAKRWRFQDFK